MDEEVVAVDNWGDSDRSFGVSDFHNFVAESKQSISAAVNAYQKEDQELSRQLLVTEAVQVPIDVN